MGQKGSKGTGETGKKKSTKASTVKPTRGTKGAASSATKSKAPQTSTKKAPTPATTTTSSKPITKPTRGSRYKLTVLENPTASIFDHYDFGKKLGEGSFGICFLGTNKSTGEQVAIKKISKGKILSQEEAKNIKNEILIMEAVVQNEHIVTIYGAYEDDDSVYIVLELCAGGDLFEKIIAKGKYSEQDCATFCRQMLMMLDYCHKNGVVHRDLKPENFLLDSDNEDATLKATDFGLSTFFNLPGVLSEPCGTPMYIAPEVIRGKYTHKADIWSAGVVLYILLSGKVPFYGKTDEDVLRATLRGKYNLDRDPWPYISDDAKECVKLMLTMDPELRPDAETMLAHPWMKVDGIASDEPLVQSIMDNLKNFSEMNKFKRRALQVMATNMKEEDIQKMKQAFDEVDTDGSGTITIEEMKAALHRLGNNVADEEVQKMWETFDLDGNGTIDYVEFLTATTDLKKLNNVDNFRYAFKKFDKDGDGSITAEEVLIALRDIGVDGAQAREIVASADKNKDGVIDYDEFVIMMTEQENTEEASKQVKTKNIGHLATKVVSQVG
ncbi:hypothetical protein NDN08_007397 [Rhodosorus marinus]|uniref:Calmodulin n=1 Tax=Rhodosorus marinus TaxID=101924 RepID=A0AAV8V1P3_9RHOD|nr:hypothetical protein NDN08_007397 [Rhodosorus marinus]